MGIRSATMKFPKPTASSTIKPRSRVNDAGRSGGNVADHANSRRLAVDALG